ncbi:MAG: hypothetical protein K0M64_08680 [Rhizobium sp.]|nr:hypothetical protein [Rhizobium sp.]
MHTIADPVIGQLELLDSVGSWQRAFELPGFPPAELHLEANVVMGAAGDSVFQWPAPSREQQATFLALEKNAASIAEQCIAMLAEQAALHGALFDSPRPRPVIVIGTEEEIATFHFAVSWEPEHGCTLRLDGLEVSTLE